MTERESLIFKATLAEQAQQYDEMVSQMNALVRLDLDLTFEERQMLAVAYKNKLEARRASWRIVSFIEEGKSSGVEVGVIKAYRETIESELKDICGDILDLLDKRLIPGSNNDSEAKVFYYKMKADYRRYTAEFTDDRDEVIGASLKAYEKASAIAESELPTAHPIRLALALNFSVFCYEILKSPRKALETAETALNRAADDLGNYQDSAFISKLIRNNLSLWNAELQEAGGETDDEDDHESDDDVNRQGHDEEVEDGAKVTKDNYRNSIEMMQLLRENLTS